MRLRLHIILFSLYMAAPALAQQSWLKRGDRSFEAFSYLEAAAYYEQGFQKGAESITHARRLAQCYWNLREFDKAAPWYAKVAASAEAVAEDMYRHAELLRAAGSFAESDLWIERFAELAPHDSRGTRKRNSLEKFALLMDEAGLSHRIVHAPFNSDRTDMSPFIHGDRIIFTSARAPEHMARRHHTWNDQPFLSLFTGELDEEGNVSDIKPFRGIGNSGYHESNAIISNDGTELYFTRNGPDAGDVKNLQLYLCRKEGDRWSKALPFVHNDARYNLGHPALSKDGRRLYFTSDMPGGHGGSDIWMSERAENGEWNKPSPLGPEVNTEGDELFPYVHGNHLYFSSDGHLGLGGSDIFRVHMRRDGHGEAENLNMPINSPKDDFGICLNASGDIGFLTSDRQGAIGGEDIFLFHMNSKPEDERVWMGRVMDERTARPVPYLKIELLDGDRNKIDETSTSQNGIYEFKDPGQQAFVSTTIPGGVHMEVPLEEIAVSKHGDTELPDMYLNSVMDLPVNAILKNESTGEFLEGVSVTVRDSRDSIILFHGITNEHGITQGQIPDRRYGDDLELDVTLRKDGFVTKTVRVDFRVLMFLEQALVGPDAGTLAPMVVGTDLGRALGLRPIFFEYANAEITPEAAAELDKVAGMLLNDPNLRIDLRSHTDSRASASYNDRLSQERAEASRAYLIARSIPADRITAKGYGERRLVNHCADGVPCSEEEHHLNRRTEFIILDCTGCR